MFYLPPSSVPVLQMRPKIRLPWTSTKCAVLPPGWYPCGILARILHVRFLPNISWLPPEYSNHARYCRGPLRGSSHSPCPKDIHCLLRVAGRVPHQESLIKRQTVREFSEKGSQYLESTGKRSITSKCRDLRGLMEKIILRKSWSMGRRPSSDMGGPGVSG